MEMKNTDLQVFMQNLNRLICANHNLLIRNNPIIEAKKTEIELLYVELSSLIKSCFKNMPIDEEQLHELADVEHWKKKIMDVAHEAEDIVDMFISSAILMNDNSLQGEGPSNVLDSSLNLKDVMNDLKSIRKDMKKKKHGFWGERLIRNSIIKHLVKKDVMVKMYEWQNAGKQAVGTSASRKPEIMNQRATEHEEVIVGFDEDALSIMDRLAGDRKQLDIISIVGMGGLGKTTLATKIFRDQYAVYYFDVRGWITVSQAYTKRDFLLGLLESIGKSDCEATSELKLSEMLYRCLKGKKYLIIIDDIWSAETWDDLRLYFPDDNTGSRVVLTTRLTEVALHASRGGFTHNQRYLTEEESWELLSQKAFRGDECPDILVEAGKRIAQKCQGLPLALVVIAGILEKGEKTKDLWDKVGKSVSSYVVDDPNGCLDTLALSYDHLPRHLRNCFLYAGGFPEDYKIQVRRLIRIWMAEGFIKEEGQKTLEEQSEAYLIDLVERNLLIVADRRLNGGIKSIRLHDLLRELCLKKATEENFFKKIGMSPINSTSSVGEQHRLFTDYKVLCEISVNHSFPRMRSVFCFSNSQLLGSKTGRWAPSFILLRVLDLQNISRADLNDIKILIHLRYLAVWSADQEFPSSIGNLWSLQSLILKGKFLNSMYSPDNMENMLNLRHLCSERIISIQSIFHVLNLQTISRLKLDKGSQNLFQYFPNIKKLGCYVSSVSANYEFLNFALLTHLQVLNLQNDIDIPLSVSSLITFPETLKNLTLRGCRLPWSYMSTFKGLHKLEVLKLLDSSFEGPLWDTSEQQFCQLKFLKLQKLNIESWEASSVNFPCLKKLVVKTCKIMKEIPLDIGTIFTLENIEIDDSSSDLVNSVNRIQEEQRAMGNYDLKIIINETRGGNFNYPTGSEPLNQLDYCINNNVLVKLSLEKLNYNSCSSFFKIHLGRLCLKKHVEDASTSTSTIDPEWSKLDDLVKMWILGTLSESLQDQVVTSLGNHKDLWDHIKDIFLDNEDAREINLNNQISSTKIGNLSINAYFTKIQNMADRLKILGTLVSDKNIVMYALNGLNSNFKHLA
ncbi:NB-ARC domains-containing protein [Artemisia annua]|uniref:NB-ARC domains-containing protein n=1 Tax=Artemisia annua TaxID=35608 RepID=A0A2U1P3A9_ARTAN|nr:NB-ARC domains-containing protein [Artemisia annua]